MAYQDRLFSREAVLRWRRIVTRAAIAVGGLVVSFCLVAFVLFKYAAIDTYVKERAIPALSRKLGRPITVGEVRARFLPNPCAEVLSVSVAGLPGEPPLIVVSHAKASVDIWRLLFSIGKDVRISVLELSDGGLNLVRLEETGWTARDVARALETPSDSTVALSHVMVKNAKVAFFDRTSAAPARGPVTALSSIATARMQIAASLDPHRPEAFSMRLTDVIVEGRGVQLGGSATMSGSPVLARLDLAGKLLDLDELLRPSSSPAEATALIEVIPSSVRADLAAARVTGSLRVERVVSAGLLLTDLFGGGELASGIFTLKECTAKMFGGTSDFSGTEVGFRSSLPDWHLSAHVHDIDVGAAVAEVFHRRPIDGRLSSDFALWAKGNDWAAVRPTATGEGQATVSGATLTVDLGARVARGVRNAFARLGLGWIAPDVGTVERTRLGQVTMKFKISEGFVHLEGPIRLETSFGTVSLEGRVALDGRLDLRGTVGLLPDLLARLSSGRLKPHAVVAIPIIVGGTLADPEVTVALSSLDLTRALFGTWSHVDLLPKLRK
jgi:uncharacterized protein involved in outer membrane biogenesis